MKYLGFKIDNKLSCIEHTKYCYDKALKVLNALRGISRNNWGLSSYAMKTIYSGAIEPILTYRAQVWGEAINKIHIRCKFISIQRIAAISICKSYRTTPTNSFGNGEHYSHSSQDYENGLDGSYFKYRLES